MHLEIPYQNFPQKICSKQICGISQKNFGHPTNFFWTMHRRPTNLGAAGEASSAAGETPAPTTLGLPTRLGYIGDAPRVALPHLP